ncbi:polyketide synthase dehydratase domain-containing protein [Steroidobacter sp. S1-65]|uniref:Polyketide synthase dehydratase domain-containing protein n=1 Tax=Steroidobacter gossypii TaxID=2805490 RepID=A0ABS1X5V0_9GAMM|nr:beta-ketoacyl synthase N-terminal-like domain-containing protein [Steroidobacter gossypii]MBM0108589.1 polyketide synthase dehydratase domain-containing protein [Steroidobacter gossypii]
MSAPDLEAARLPAAAECLATAIVAAQVRALFADANGEYAPTERLAMLRTSHRRWLDATLRHLEAHRLVAVNPLTGHCRFLIDEAIEALWPRWDAATPGWCENANHRAYLTLIETCLRRLTEILTGALPATDVVFPDSSMHLVEGIYKHNLIADHFNRVLGDNLRAELAARAARGERGLRLLEIGAGTGGTTAALLPMLRGFGDLVEEYCYTDLSKAFLLHAQEAYKPEFPALRTAIFDVGKPLSLQSIEGNRYDAVIATNVLHATSDMRETVRNAKALLKRGGILLVNELSAWSWQTHFTFGLLDGWWLYEDEKLRLPGSPCLSPAQWESLLKAERFLDIRFPAHLDHGLGQLVMAARSDGVVRQRLVPPVAPAKSALRKGAPVVAPSSSAALEMDSATTSLSASTSALVAPDDAALRAACALLFREMIAGALRMDAGEIENHKPLERYGLDSILVVQLTTHFRKIFPGTRSTLFFEVHSIDGLVEYFLEHDREAVARAASAVRTTVPASAAAALASTHVPAVSAPGARAPAKALDRTGRRRLAPRSDAPSALPIRPAADATPSVDAPAERASRFDVAIIGVSGRYPQAPDLESFWDNLASGRSCASEVPADRWRWQDYYDAEKGKAGKSCTRWGGFLNDIDKFDPLFFRIAPKEAKKIDPQERLFLETSYHAIEDSGYTPATLAPGGKVGVFVGVMNSRYTVQPLFYSIANRVSFLFNFSGPSLAVDSACSSSLTSIHLALDSLYSGMCEAAIAGGVSLIVDPQHMLELTALGMLSEGAQCRSFGRNADGFVDAEGVGAVVLKPLDRALRDGDTVYAVIKGSALNAGGRTNGYTVPNPAAQAEVVSSALARANIDSAEVSYIEAHGTGTALGDPIEVAGLTKAFRASRRAPASAGAERQHCAIGSLKSNIGHCESAAGIAALTKVLLQFRHGQLVPTLHADEVNDEIDFATTPFRLQRTLAPWHRPVLGENAAAREVPRIAGISSFGAGGANAHLVLQEPPSAPVHVDDLSQGDNDGACVVPLSARTPEQLQWKIERLLGFLQRDAAQQRDVALRDIAYTLQVGREAMDERIAFIATSLDDLRCQVQALSEAAHPGPGPHRGSVRNHKEFLAACKADPAFTERRDGWLVQRDLARIAEHWVKGVEIDWARLHAGARPRRIPLPAYPFARDRHWIEPQRTLARAAAAAHPLLQRNTSTLRGPAYSVGLKGDERFLAQDAAGRRRLPALLCLEMARAAIAAAYPDDVAARELRFEDVVADDPILVNDGCELHIALLPDTDDVLGFEIYLIRGGIERVHCQGRASFAAQDAQDRADVAALAARLARGVSANDVHDRLATLGMYGLRAHRLARTGREVVLEFAAEAAGAESWTLPPDALASVPLAAAWLLDELGQTPAVPSDVSLRAVQTVRLWSGGERPAYLILSHRDDDSGRYDIALYDADGKPCLHADGLHLEWTRAFDDVPALPSAQRGANQSGVIQAAAAALAETAAPTPTLSATGTRIAFLPPAPSPEAHARTGVVTAKPNVMRLREVDEIDAVPALRPTGTSRIALPSPDADLGADSGADATPACVELRGHGSGVFSVALLQPVLDRAVIAQLLLALEHLREREDTRLVLFVSAETNLLHGSRDVLDDAIAAGLYRAVVEFPLPTVAVLGGGADGPGFLLGALCDFMICARESRYGFDPERGAQPTPAEAALLAARFGDAWTEDLIYVSGALSGRELAQKGWTVPVVARDETMAAALSLAECIATKPRDSLHLLKTHMAAALQDCVSRLGSHDRPTADASDAPPFATVPVVLPRTRPGITVEYLSDAAVSVRFADSAGDTTAATLLRDLRATLAELAQHAVGASVVLSSDLDGFLPAIGEAAEAQRVDSELAALQLVLCEYPSPVVVAFEGDADGAGWLLGLSADACVHAERARYSTDALWRHPSLLRRAAVLLAHRLGANCAKRCLFEPAAVAGAELASGAAVVRGDAADVLAHAWALADGFPLRSPALRARRRAAVLARLAEPFVVPDSAAGDTGRVKARRPMPEFPAIETEVRGNGVLVVRMVDREAKNMFSPALVRGLEEVFAHIEGSGDYRAVVLCGYDTYFACGGTRDSLLAIQQGEAKFTDTKIYQLPMSCSVPVVAAMQGHAIGGGWALGMFADVCLFSAESRYISPYMQYGFTPGAGSTLIFPATLGLDLAKETLFTAAEYTGSALQAKGLPHQCLPRGEVLPRALALADALASHNREWLIALKRYFSTRWLATVEQTYERELAMHERSFVGRQDALRGINENFAVGEKVANHREARAPETQATSLAHELKALLAAELQMSAEHVEEDAQFVDLGLDSITGVTWVKKINNKYRTRIEATKVYAYPTLRQFAVFVQGLVSEPTTESLRTPTQRHETRDAVSTLCRELKRLLAQELHMAEAEVDDHRQFVDMGLDSITGVTWVRKINALYGSRIEATKVYSYPTLIEFSRFLSTLSPVQARLQGAERRDEPVKIQSPRPSANPSKRMTSWRNRSAHRRSPAVNGTEAIAVIGISGQFPQASDLEAFWRNIAGARDCIDPVPPQRWNIDDYFNADVSVAGTTNSRWMGVLEDCDAFDPLFFNISPTEAESMDPQQRLVLQSCWHAIENAAINPRSLSGSRCGVFIGCGATDYHQRSREHQYSAQGFTGASMSILAARISYFLNLQGPCLSIDTACSSSLVAIANACDSLAAHNCDTALAGGVAVMAGPTMHIKTAQAGMLSPDGKCFAFDQRANGFVAGEGVGVVMLKRLADAIRDGDIIHATIRGWGVNQDGKTNGITAPNPISQARLMRAIYDRFGIDPEDIQLIEAHGTGTKLGDPIEVEGLTAAFRHYTQKQSYCALGSVKSNIGHCLYAAGVAGVLKLVLALKQGQLPPTANFERLNEHIDLVHSPFVINTELKPWSPNAKGGRMAAVSSFGFSGTNAHLVLEAAAPLELPALPSSQPVMIPLSAKSKEQLRQKALDLAEFVERRSVSLADLAYTLQVGRESMDERCATVVSSTDELMARLRAFAAGATPSDVYVGDISSRASKLALVQKDRELQEALVERCMRDGKLGTLMELWADGLELAWDKIQEHAGSNGRSLQRIELPLYPFAKERYWLADETSRIEQAAAGVPLAIHPLLHVNASTLNRQRYRTTFRGDESYLRDHRLRLTDGRVERVLPGVAYLEMAAAAVGDALPERAASQQLMLSDVVWWSPVVVNEPTTVHVELAMDEDGAIVYEIVSDGCGERIVHCQGEARFVEATAPERIDTTALAADLNAEAWQADKIYAAFTQLGLHYGAAHRSIERLRSVGGKVAARIALPACVARDSDAYRLHPSVMDGALQACIGFLPSLDSLPQAPSVPFTLQSIRILAPCPHEVIVVLTPTRAVKGVDTETCDISVCAPDGQLCVEIRNFTRRALDARKAPEQTAEETTVFDEAFYRELLANIAHGKMLAEEAVELE